MVTLFDDVERTDSSPRRSEEDSFSFLNRVDTPFWNEVRRVLEEWFGRYPAEAAAGLREAFRSKLPGQHWGAWWELYLHELFNRMGYEVTVHPTLPDSAKTPDFELRRDGSRVYVEATAVFSGLVSDAMPAWLPDVIDTIDNGDFFLRLVDVGSRGDERPKRREIAGPLQAWLAGLDPDDALRQHAADGSLPRRSIDARGWEVTFEAWPVRAPARARPGRRVFAGGPVLSGFVDDIGQLQAKLKTKAGRYGRPEAPFVTAVLCMSPFMERLDVEQALFGREAFELGEDLTTTLVRQRDGFWVRGDGPQNQRVSAVLTAVNLLPWNVTRVSPDLWLNPWANHPLDQAWPFPEAAVTDDGRIVYREEAQVLGHFGLPADWPGGRPFPRD